MTEIVAALGGIVATLLAVFVAWKIGLIQISWMRQEHQLNVLRASPKIGTSLRIEERNINGPAYAPWYYLITSIYNEGELAASNLNGQWKLTSPNRSVIEGELPISREFLGPTPYQLEPFHIIGGTVVFAMEGNNKGNTVTFKVDVEFDYTSMTNEQPQHYSAHYEFDHKYRKMIKT
jgi:hypothetical protein